MGAAEKLTERLCQCLYDSDPVGVSEELVRLASCNAPWPDILCGASAYASRYRVTDWFSAHWLNCLVASYLLATRISDPFERLLPFIQGVWILSGSGESSLAGFIGMAEGRKAQALRIPPPRIPAASESLQSASDRFLAAFCDGQIEDAQAILIGVWRAGFSPGEIKDMILRACTIRYAMDGHPLINAVWVFRLLDRIDWRDADLHLAALVVAMRDCWELLHHFPSLPPDDEIHAKRWLVNNRDYVPIDPQPVLDTFLYGTLEETNGRIVSLLDQGISSHQICHYITLGMSHRILNIPRPDSPEPDAPYGWVFYLGEAYHVLMVVEPLREVLVTNPSPATLRGVFQEALYLNSIKVREQAAPHPDFSPVALTDEERRRRDHEVLEDLRDAIIREKGGLAAALSEAYLSAGHPPEALLQLFLEVQRKGFSAFTIPEHYSHGVYFIQGVVDEYLMLEPQLDRTLLLIAAAKVIAMFTRKDETLKNHLRGAIEAYPVSAVN